MSRAGFAGRLALGLVGLVLVTAGTAQAVTQTVETPAETAYLTYHGSVEFPDTRGELVCLPLRGCFVITPVYVDDLGAVEAGAGLWVEDNGCDGLQRSAGDCDHDNEPEPADEHVASVDREIDP